MLELFFGSMKSTKRSINAKEEAYLIQCAKKTVQDLEISSNVEGSLLDLINTVYSQLSIASIPSIKSAKELNQTLVNEINASLREILSLKQKN